MTFHSERANRMRHLAILASASYVPESARSLYFIRAGESGPVKIGVAGNVLSRLVSLQTAHYEPLHVIGEISEHGRIERTLHAAFAGDRIRGEWFRPSSGVLAAADGVMPERLLDLPSLVPGGKPWRHVNARNLRNIAGEWHLHTAGLWRAAYEFMAFDLHRYSTIGAVMVGLDEEAAA